MPFPETINYKRLLLCMKELVLNLSLWHYGQYCKPVQSSKSRLSRYKKYEVLVRSLCSNITILINYIDFHLFGSLVSFYAPPGGEKSCHIAWGILLQRFIAFLALERFWHWVRNGPLLGKTKTAWCFLQYHHQQIKMPNCHQRSFAKTNMKYMWSQFSSSKVWHCLSW